MAKQTTLAHSTATGIGSLEVETSALASDRIALTTASGYQPKAFVGISHRPLKATV